MNIVKPDELAGLEWFKSSLSGGANNGCVEIAFATDGTYLRDTKDEGDGPVLFFLNHEWEAFVGGAKRGEFDK